MIRGPRPTLELRFHRPAEGWLSYVLLAALAVILAWAIDEPAWVDGKRALTQSLPQLALLGLAFGTAGPKLGWGRWTTHLVGAAFAALLIPVIAGWAVEPGSTISDAFTATATGTVNAYLDIARRGRQFTTEEVHYILVLGIVVWGTMQFAASAVYGHRRPLNAVLVVGLVLVANMALTSRDQLRFLVSFTVASLLLLIQMHAFDERATWLRRRIGDPSAISSLYLRGGAVFIAVAVAGSLLLTQRASSNPLAGAWGRLDQQLIGVGETLSRLFPIGGDLRGGGNVTFGSTARIGNQWFSNDGVAFEATVPAGTPEGLDWRAATYDTFQLQGWTQTATSAVAVAAGNPLLAGTREAPSPELTRPITVEVRPQAYHEALLLSPGTPVIVNRDASVRLAGDLGWFAGVELPGGSSTYTVVARTLRLGDQEVISGNRLRAAGTDYPADVRARYTAVPNGAMEADATALLAAIRATASSSNPYDLAVAMVAYLRDDTRFTYTTDVRGVSCDSASAVECFARTRQGYCLHYASTMAILLRAANPANPIPTRLVQGFLPGKRVNGVEKVTNRAAHAWVEVYFPGYGWIPFDPTGGGIGQASVIPEGPPVASATPASSAVIPQESADAPGRRSGVPGQNQPSGSTPPSGPEDRTLAILLTVTLALVIGGLAFAAWLRGPRGEISPELAWTTMSRSASRLGFARRPTQTIYEYAASLGDLVPVARADLQTVAEAKVEVSYARARLDTDRLGAVRDATRRLRISLLRLIFRRRIGRR